MRYSSFAKILCLFHGSIHSYYMRIFFFFVIYCFNKHHLIYFPGNDLGFIILKWNDINEVTNRSDCEKPLHYKNVLNYFKLQKKFFIFCFYSHPCVLLAFPCRIAMNLWKSLTADEIYDTYVDFNDDLELDINILIRKASC